MSHFRLVAAIISVVLVGLGPPAFGLAGNLDAPSLSFPANSKSQKAVMEVISDKQFRFLRGRFVNAFSTLLYGGDADSLNTFLSKLARCPGAKVTVAFDKGGEDASWILTHNAWGDPDTFHIVVNTARIAEASVKIPK